MADQPTVTTPGGSDLFASLHSLDYDETMALLIQETSSSTTTSTGRTPTFKTGLTPGGYTNNTRGNHNGHDPFLMTPRTAEFMAELAASSTPLHSNSNVNSDPHSTAMLFDHDLVASSQSRDVDDDDDDGDALRPDDLPTPLSFSFTPTNANGMGANGRYHVAAAHKHKRVRSNPDMLQSLNYQQLMGPNTSLASSMPSSAPSPLRPSVGDGHAMHAHGHGSAMSSLPTTPLDTSHASYEPLPATLPVNVITPIAFHAYSPSDDTFPSDMDSFLKDVQWSELGENNTNATNVDTLSSLGAGQYHRSQRIQAGMNELKMKRKRPTPQHARHHSNPVDLLHNLDQFRMLSQQQQQQQQQQLQQLQHLQQVQQQQQQGQQHQPSPFTPPPSPPIPVAMPMQYPSPIKLGSSSSLVNIPPHQQQQQPHHMMMASPPPTANPFAMASPPTTMHMQQHEMHFQVPVDIANGSARSLHARRSSMPSTAFAPRGRGGGGGPGHHRRGAARGGSTGLSMDMSQMNLDFLSLPEDEFQQQLHHQRQQQQGQQQQPQQQHQAFHHPHAMMNGAFPSPPSSPPLQRFQQQQQGLQFPQPDFMDSVSGMTAAEIENEKNRKSYKCGRCGKPKVGHVCTMPDLRNNWTQCDVDVTKGLKLLRANVQIVATKNAWVPQHDDHL